MQEPLNFFHEVDPNPEPVGCSCDRPCGCGETWVMGPKDTVPFYEFRAVDACLYCGTEVNKSGRCTNGKCGANHY